MKVHDEDAHGALQVFDKLVAEAGRRGILIMLDCHHLSIAGGITELWHDGTTSEAQLIQAWTTVVSRYRSAWNVFAGQSPLHSWPGHVW